MKDRGRGHHPILADHSPAMKRTYRALVWGGCTTLDQADLRVVREEMEALIGLAEDDAIQAECVERT
jgi:hypothetical protein